MECTTFFVFTLSVKVISVPWSSPREGLPPEDPSWPWKEAAAAERRERWSKTAFLSDCQTVRRGTCIRDRINSHKQHSGKQTSKCPNQRLYSHGSIQATHSRVDETPHNGVQHEGQNLWREQKSCLHSAELHNNLSQEPCWLFLFPKIESFSDE